MASYDLIGGGYRRRRVPDARIAAQIAEALGDARTVLNVGAGAGSYEPAHRRVVAVEPSSVMIAQRPGASAPVVQARAEELPFATDQFDAAMAVLTVHHWSGWESGMAELARVARAVVLLTWDPGHEGFWLTHDYFPDLLALDRAIFPPLGALAAVLGRGEVRPVLVPHDCTDGFTAAYWRRPEAYLDAGVRGAMSSFTRIGHVEARLSKLEDDLESGRWSDRHEDILQEESLDAGYRIVVWR